MIDTELNMLSEMISESASDSVVRRCFYLFCVVFLSTLFLRLIWCIFDSITCNLMYNRMKKNQEKYQEKYIHCIYPDDDEKRGRCERCMYGFETYVNQTDRKWYCLLDNIEYEKES